MAKSSGSSSGGIGFCEMLAILFIGLKLAGTIDWSWWWVMAPLWMPLVGVLLIIQVISRRRWSSRAFVG